MPRKKSPNLALVRFGILLPYFENGWTNCCQISRETGLKRKVVYRLFRSWKNKKPLSELGRIGRPPKVNTCVKKSISAIVRHHPEYSAKQVSNVLEHAQNCILTEKTIQRTLSAMGYEKSKPRNIPMLTQKQREDRLQWGKDNLNRDWSKVIFSDESSVQLFSNSIKYWGQKGTIRCAT